MIYVTGDIHADADRFGEDEYKKLKKGDTLLICGDFGFLWNGGSAEKSMLKHLGKRKYTIAFLDGAHENFSLLDAYPVVDWNGGKARHITGRLYHLCRGQIFTLEGHTFFVMGGGVSSENEFRDEDEQTMCRQVPSRDELLEANQALQRMNGRVDYILTHEPPEKIKSFLLLKENTAHPEPTRLNRYFEELSRVVTFKRWFFGSMHLDKQISSTHCAVFRKVVPIG